MVRANYAAQLGGAPSQIATMTPPGTKRPLQGTPQVQIGRPGTTENLGAPIGNLPIDAHHHAADKAYNDYKKETPASATW